MFHPLVGADGEVDLSVPFPMWRAHEDLIWHILVYVKTLFYRVKSSPALNSEAASMFEHDLDTFKYRAQASAQASLQRLYLGGDEGVRIEPWSDALEREFRAQVAALDTDAGEALAGASEAPALTTPVKRK
eukprot:c4358_g1_i1.p1 GENE.c4358_g1_i1~~c4358_g1_i1.p1  ORF type:complete len:131 (+),score=24.89 c4358_g1_i1:425-817(+)